MGRGTRSCLNLHRAVDEVSRLFIAVWPPEPVLDLLSGIPAWHDQGVRHVPREQWHITLRFLGDADADEVADALSRTELRGATACLGPALDVLGDHSIVVPVAGLDDLAHAIADATTGLGDSPRRRRFRGHITVARLRRGARPSRVLGQPITDTASSAPSTNFGVDEVALVESVLGPDGPEYTTVQTWPAR